ncbi:transposase [Candidatus Kaiserbacteria bacterium]|nr:transposase [Candidatus Kaiserbacteria bacterium]
MERKHIISEGEYYHLYNRGVEKRNVFLTQKDYARFRRLLYVANGTEHFVYRDIERKSLKEIDCGEPLVAIAAWVLMPNHFHILVKEITEGGTAAFMEKLCTSYSSYFNKRHDRVGPLFQGRYKSQHVTEDTHLKYLFAYIHLNPLKLIDPAWKEKGSISVAAAKKFISSYEHSSYLSYMDTSREESILLSKNEFPEYFSENKDFEDFHNDLISFSDTDT